MTDIDRHATPATIDDRPTLASLIDAAIEQADRQRTELAEAGDLEGLAHGLAAIRDVQRKLAMLESQTNGDVSRLNRDAGNRAEIPGLGILETARRSNRTRWDSERLYGRLVDSIAAIATVDPATGEITGDMDTADSMAHLLREQLAPCLPLTASCGWRTTGLKNAGLDPNQFRDVERGPDSTRIIGPEGIS